MLNSVSEFVANFECVTDAGANYMVRCPGHQDNTPSLSISKGDVRKDGLPVYHCFAGCSQEHLKQVFRSMGLVSDDGSSKWDPTQINNDYAQLLALSYGLQVSDFTAAGVSFEVERFFPALSKKADVAKVAAFAYPVECLDCTPRSKYKSFYRMRINDGKLTVKHPGSRTDRGKREQVTDRNCKGFFLGRNLRRSAGDTRPLVLLRGEEKALICDKAGLRAVSASTGEGNLDNDYIEYLKQTGNTEVIIIDDNDGPGMKGTMAALLALEMAGIGARGVLWPESLPAKYDVNDYGRDLGLEQLAKLPLSAMKLHNFKDLAEPRIAKLEQEAAQQQKEKQQASIGKIQSGGDLLLKEIKPVEWLVEGVLPSGMTLMAGPSKVGKTTLVMQMLAAMWTGTDFMGYAASEAKILYLNYDMSEALLKQYLTDLIGTLPEFERQHCIDKFRENFYYIDNPDFQFGGPNFIEDMKAMISQVCPDIKLIVVDTLEQSCPASTKSNSNAYQQDIKAHKHIRRFHNETGISLLFIHHTNKSTAGDPFAKITGSTGITASYDTLYVLDKDTAKDAADVDYNLHIKGRQPYASDALPIKRTAQRKWAFNDLKLSNYALSNY